MSPIQNYNFEFNYLNETIEFLKTISPKNLGNNITEEDKANRKDFINSKHCNPLKRRNIIWRIINASTVTDSLFSKEIVELLRDCCRTIDLVTMIKFYSRNLFFNTSFFDYNDQIIKDRSSYVDKNAIKIINYSITLYNSFNPEKFPEHCARELLKQTINKLIYFNIVCVSNELSYRKKQLRVVYETIKYHEENEDFDMAYRVEKLHKNLRDRYNYIVKNNVPYFNTPLITNYVNEIICIKNCVFVDEITLFYFNDWNIFLKNELLLTIKLGQLINKIEYTQAVINNVNFFVLKEKFKGVFDNSQQAIINLLKIENIKILQIIEFIMYFKIDLKDYPEIPLIILEKFSELSEDSNTYKIVTPKVCEFLWYISVSLEVDSYTLRNVFFKSIFKTINTNKFDIRIDFILTNLHYGGKFDSLINYFAYENEELNIDSWNKFIDTYYNYNINYLSEKVSKKREELEKEKASCIDSLTCKIIEEPIIIPKLNFVDKYSIYPYLLRNKINPYNRQPLTIESIEEFNKNNDSLIEYKSKHGYAEKKIN